MKAIKMIDADQVPILEWSFERDRTINFLLLCLRPDVTEQTAADIRQAASEIDWGRLIEFSRTHYVLPLLYRRLSEVCSEQVPPERLAEMHRLYQDLVIQNLLLTHELTSLLKMITDEGIDVMPYKGPVLAQALYDEVDLRQFGDLDVIIAPKDMQAVEKLMLKAGYQHYLGAKTAVELRAYLQDRANHTYDFLHPTKGILVEVHWRFWPVYFSAVHPSQVWSRRQSSTLLGRSVSTLSIEDYLLILCMHGSRHMWLRLSWLCDIAVLLHKHLDLDWEKVMTRARLWGCQRMLKLGLFLAYSWFECCLPPDVLHMVLADKRMLVLSSAVDLKIFGLTESKARLMSMTRYQFQIRERLGDKAAYLGAFVPWLKKNFRMASV